MSDNSFYMYKVKSKNGSGEFYWDWCSNNLEVGTWKMMIGIMGESSSYHFIHEEDAMAFKLRFGL